MKPPTSDSSPNPLRPAWRGLRRFVLARRRLVAGVCAALAVAAGLSALRPDDPATRPVVVAAHDLDSGVTLSDEDVEIREVRADDAATHSYEHLEPVVGEVVGAPVRDGEPITDLRLLTTDVLDGYPADSSLATVRVTDPQSLWGVEVGTYVDVVGVDVEGRGRGRVLATHAQVVAMPEAEEEPTTGMTAGAALVLNVPADEAVTLTDAATRMQLGVVVSRS